MKKLVYFMTITSVLACSKYEKIEDFPIESPKLVANSIFTEGEPFNFKISRSLSVLDNAQLNHITDAQLILFRDQVAVDTLQGANDGILYRSKIMPEKSYNYHLQVSHPRYDTISSLQERLPASLVVTNLQCVMIDSVTGTRLRWNSDQSDTLVISYVLDCSITILDNGITENIYSLGIEKWDSIRFYEGVRWERRYPHILTSDDPSLINNTGIGTNRIMMDRMFFNNHSFAGKEYSFSFTIEEKDQWSYGSSLHRQYTLILYSYSHSSYMYARTRNFGHLLQTPFDEPYSVYSNIEGGYGIFSGIELKEISLGR